ncbi:MAG: phenylalanine--tRNA ligase beta subunit-related protein [Candidatus Paceibacterota bacterium]|jgi:phenylalanyl-tRNA synthetase beta subunit
MKVSYKWLNEFLGGKALKVGKFAELLTMNSVEIESIEKAGGDFVLDAKTTPNLNHHLLCHRGIAREAGVLADIKVSQYSREFANLEARLPSERKLKVNIVDGKLCRRYTGRIVENVKVGPSPKWLAEKLEILGQRSINNIVDATNFLMLELGQPMHAFDADKLAKSGEVIISVQNAKKGDKIVTLDKKDIELDESVLLITDGKNPLAIAGVKGGTFAELDENTTNVVLESANFAPTLIRKTSQKFKIQTDASKRYENDLTPELCGEAMDILTKLIVEIAGTKDTKVGEVVDNYPRPAGKYKLGISAEEASDIIGVKISDKEIAKIFDRFGFEYKKVKPIDEVLKMAPTFVGIPYKYGASVSYDAPRTFDCSGFICYLFRETGVGIPRTSIDQYVFGKPISEKDLRLGDEVFSNTKEGKIHYETKEFLPGTKVPEGVDHCGLYLGDGKIIHATGLFGKVVIEDLNKSDRFKNIVGYRRMAENTERFVITVPDERLDLRIKEDLAEEIGRIYGYDKIKDVKISNNSGKTISDKAYFYKTEVRKVLVSLGFSEIINYTFREKGEVELANTMSPEKRFLRTNLSDGLKEALEFNARYSDFIDMSQIKIFEFGHIFTKKGEFDHFAIGAKNSSGVKKPKEIETLDIAIKSIEEKTGLVLNRGKEEVVIEVDFSDAIRDLPEAKEYDFTGIESKDMRFSKISQYPFMVRDVAVFTPEGTKPKEVFEIIEKWAGILMVKNKLFDVFTKKFPDGTSKISYAYRLVFQSYERTLTDDEVNKIMEKITSELNSQKGWQVR